MADEGQQTSAKARIYPKPSRSSTERAIAHQAMAEQLLDLEMLCRLEKRRATSIAVIVSERRRQQRLVAEYRYRYGPNAEL